MFTDVLINTLESQPQRDGRSVTWSLRPTTHLLQRTELVAGGVRERLGGATQNSDEHIQALLVLGQQGGRCLVVLPQEQADKPGFRPLQGGTVWVTLLEEAVQEPE